MGMFDSIYVQCPHCGASVEFQSKAWNCDLDIYTLDDAPLAILIDVMNAPRHCFYCDQWIALIDTAFPPEKPWRPNLEARKERPTKNPLEHHEGYKWWPGNLDFSSADLIEESE